MNGKGFLGTNASVLADLSLLVGVFVAVLLSIGVVMARRRRYVAHRWIQTTAVALNITQVLAIMATSFWRSAAPGIPAKLAEPFYYAATIHAALGLITLLFGAFVALRGNDLVPRALKFHNYKLFMRTAYGAYLIVTALGVGVYLTWYTGTATPVNAANIAQPIVRRQNEIIVPMANFEFNPKEVIIPVGATVIWVNQDNAPHTATADDGARFTSEVLANGQRFTHTFTQAGVFAYFCELHGSAGGIGMAGTIKVVPPDQAPALIAAAPTPAPPTPQPTPPPLPAGYFGQPVGTAAFRDAAGRSDQLTINLRLNDSLPAGTELAAFLTTRNSSETLALGPLQIDGNQARLVFTTPDRGTLAGRYDRLVITREARGVQLATPAGPPLAVGALPVQAFAQFNQLLAGDPRTQGYAVGIRVQTDELVRHAQFMAAAQAAGDVAGVRRHAEHVVNLIVGSRAPDFGDLNQDGRVQNPGDGFGLLPNGDQAGYIQAVFDTALAAERAADADAAIRAHARHVEICAENMRAWAVEARDLALTLRRVADAPATKEATARLVTLARWLQRGNDANSDGAIAPIAGEGGGLVAYEHAQFMAGFGLFPARN